MISMSFCTRPLGLGSTDTSKWLSLSCQICIRSHLQDSCPIRRPSWISKTKKLAIRSMFAYKKSSCVQTVSAFKSHRDCIGHYEVVYCLQKYIKNPFDIKKILS